jgi:hypothetical protein
MTDQPELETTTATPERTNPRQADNSGTNLTIKQATERYVVGERTLRRMLKTGIPGAFRAPGRKGEQWLIPVASLEQANLKRLEQAPEPETPQPAEDSATVATLAALIDDLREERKQLTAGRDAMAERAQAMEVELAILKERLRTTEERVTEERERRAQAEERARRRRWWRSSAAPAESPTLT